MRFKTQDGQYLDTQVLAAHFVEMTPALAEWLLSMNTHNRNVRKNVVQKYTKRMVDGEFVVTNQGIGIVANNNHPYLGDGQHRILAWQAAGQPAGVEMLIVTGLEQAAQVFVDAGANRSMADMLALILDKKVGSQLVGVARLMMTMRRRLITKGNSGESGFTRDPIGEHMLSPYTIAEFIESRLADHLELLQLCRSLRAAVIAAIVEYADRWSAEAAMEFANQVVHGEHLSKSDPAYRLRDWMEKMGRKGPCQSEYYSRTVSACCAHARGSKIDKLFCASGWHLPPRRLSA
jgi:hypothetical protein